ncbi:MAG: ribbon-helix-helix domain-containing protein [Myxococcaceae bacterium]
MHDTTLAHAVDTTETPSHIDNKEKSEVVSTHVLVEEQKVEQLRELSKRTRIAQSEYLREAVDDLLVKYNKGQ